MIKMAFSLHKPPVKLSDIFRQRSSAEDLEKALSNYIGSDHILVMGSGRYGIKLALKALGISKGDEIIVPAITCSVVAQAVVENNAMPIFCDLGKNNINLNPALTREAITDNTKAIIVVHSVGIPARLDEFMRISKEMNIPIIEDCAQALGSKYQNKMVGTFGKFGIYSFGPSKNIGTPGGGAICTNDSELYSKIKNYLRPLPDISLKRNLKKRIMGITMSFAFHKNLYSVTNKFIPSSNYSTDEDFHMFEREISKIEVKMAYQQLKRYDSILKNRNLNAEIYREYFQKYLQLIQAPTDSTPSHLLFPVLTEHKNELTKILYKKSIFVGDLALEIIYRLPQFKKYAKLCKNAEEVKDRYLLFPLGHSSPDTRHICNETIKALREIN